MERPILAYITADRGSVAVINTAKVMAEQLGKELLVVTAQPIKMNAAVRSETVKRLKSISEECDVDITVRYGDSAAQSMTAHANGAYPLHIFIGEDNPHLSEFLSLYKGSPVSTVSGRVVFTVMQ